MLFCKVVQWDTERVKNYRLTYKHPENVYPIRRFSREQKPDERQNKTVD